MQLWLVTLVSLLAGVSGGPLRLSGDCSTRIVVTKSRDGEAPPIVVALSKACQAAWSDDLSKLIECLQMGNAVSNLIKETTGEAVLLQLIVTEISAYTNVAVIQNGAIEGWGTIQQFIECQGPKWINADCRARYDLLQPVTYPFLSTSISSKCFKWNPVNQMEAYNCTLMANRIGRLILEFYSSPTFTLELIAKELQEFKTSDWNKNFIETTVVGGWGTLQQFISCGAYSTTSGGVTGVTATIPSSWTYPPKGYSAGPGQQTKEVAEGNIKIALDTAKAAMEKDDELLIIDQILLFMPTGIEMLDFEKRNVIDYASFGGAVLIINEGKIAGACVKRVANKCTTESEFALGEDNYPQVIVTYSRLKGATDTERMTRVLAKSLYEQGALLDDDQ